MMIVSTILSELLGAGATEYNGTVSTLQNMSEEKHTALRALCEDGYVQSIDGQHSVSAAGIAAIVTSQEICNKEVISTVQHADRPLQERSGYEILALLEAVGWEWAAWPRRRVHPPGWKLGDDRVWYSVGARVHVSYLACLLLACSPEEADRFGDYAVEHGQTKKYYEALLARDFDKAQAILAARNPVVADVVMPNDRDRMRQPHVAARAQAQGWQEGHADDDDLDDVGAVEESDDDDLVAGLAALMDEFEAEEAQTNTVVVGACSAQTVL